MILSNLSLKVNSLSSFLLSWISSGEATGADIEVWRGESPEDNFKRIDIAKASAFIITTHANNIVSGEGFSLQNPDGTIVYKFSIDGSTIADYNVEIALNIDDSAEDVAGKISEAINNEGSFEAEVASTRINIFQINIGADGNLTNINSVDNSSFIVENFTGGLSGFKDNISSFVDTLPLNQYRRDIAYYYKVRFTGGEFTNVVNSPYKHDKHALQLIKMTERFLKRDIEGKSYLFKRSLSTDYCPECWDENLNSKIKEDCNTCDGSGRVSGYLNPVEIYVHYPMSIDNSIKTPVGSFLDQNSRAWTLGSPIINEGDVIIRDIDKEVYFVKSPIDRTGRLLYIVRQLLTLKSVLRQSKEHNLVNLL